MDYDSSFNVRIFRKPRVIYLKQMDGFEIQLCTPPGGERNFFVQYIQQGKISGTDKLPGSVLGYSHQILMQAETAFCKWEKIMGGGKECLFHGEFDILLNYFCEESTPEADLFYTKFFLFGKKGPEGRISSYVAWTYN